MMEPEDIAREYLRGHFGNMVMLGEYQFEEEELLHRFQLKTNYPFMVTDDLKSGKITVRIIRMEKLGYIFIDENMHVDTSLTSKRKDVDSKIRDILQHWRNRTEEIVATITSTNLSQLERLYSYFTPVERIIVMLLDEGQITSTNLKGLTPNRRKTYLAYIRLLEGQDLLERHNGGWRASVAMKKAILEETDTHYDMTRKTMSVLIAERYRTLKKDFNIKILEGPVRLQNVIYLPEIEIKRNLSRTIETLQREHFYHYRNKVSYIDMMGLLKDLIHIDSLKHNPQKRMYHGDTDLLEKMIKVHERMKPIGSIHTSRA